MTTPIANTSAPRQDQDYAALAFKKAALPALTGDEQARPFAKFFYQETPSPDPAHLALMDSPCDPAKGIPPARMNDLLNPGPLDVEIGWGNLPDGSGFIANRNLYTDITAEMVAWWFAWHPLEDLRYRLWSPADHAGIQVSDKDRQRLLDSSLSLAERNWGVQHRVVEDVGTGMETIDITFLSPTDFGFDPARFHKPAVALFVGGQGFSAPVGPSTGRPPVPALMCHLFRETPEGLEHRTRFWMGYMLVNGQPKLMLPPGVSVPPFVVQGLARHTISEFVRFKSLLHGLYRECGGKDLA